MTPVPAPISNEERLAYLTLALIPGIGPTRLDNLRLACGSWTGALEAPVEFLGTVPAMSRAAATAVASSQRDLGERTIEALEREGGFVLTPFDPEFPERLLPLTDPPMVLFGRGRIDLLTRPAVAIVGSRHPTSYGIAVTREAARVASGAELVVVSGMARGLDAVAHWAAIEAGGATIGVLGNGLGVVYPAANRTLYDRVIAEGLLITEYPPGERPHAGSFHQRNRLIAGLARVTMVTEAARDSGALITARAAADQGADVCAVPGPVTSRTSVGANLLIRDGASPYLEPDDLLGLFPHLSTAIRKAARESDPARMIRTRLRDDLRRVFDALDGAPRTIDALAVELAMPPGTLVQAISELEITGVVEQEGGGFRRAL